MIKKIGLTAIALCISVSSVFAAQAPTDKAYAGVDIQGMDTTRAHVWKNANINGHKQKKAFFGASVFAGYRWDSLAAELGFTGYQKAKYNTNSGPSASMTTRYNNVYLDGIYHYGIAQNVELKALVGLGMLTQKNKGNAFITNNGATTYYSNANSTRRTVSPRFGIGAQYNFSENVSSSLMYKNQGLNLNIVALSVAYHF